MDPLADRVQRAVVAICPDVQEWAASQTEPLSEAELWIELCCCILSSQVPYALAQAAAAEIGRHQLFWVRRLEDSASLEHELKAILAGEFLVDGKLRKYRFPTAKAHQLAKTWATVVTNFGDLTAAAHGFDDALEARRWFIQYLPGVGPKQASMFLRNVGGAYDLAILDRHILRYMELVGLRSKTAPPITRFTHYRDQELTLQTHAAELGYPVGMFDWAVWIVMRTLGRDRFEEEATG